MCEYKIERILTTLVKKHWEERNMTIKGTYIESESGETNICRGKTGNESVCNKILDETSQTARKLYKVIANSCDTSRWSKVDLIMLNCAHSGGRNQGNARPRENNSLERGKHVQRITSSKFPEIS